MKFLKYAICAATIALAFASTDVQGKGKMVPKIYMFGFAASFADSVVYITDVQTVDNAWIDTKTGFLLGRDSYSLQLKNYMANTMSEPNRTCIVMFDKKKSKADKQLLKMKKQYTSAKSRSKYDVRYVNSADFSFKGVDMSFVNEDDAAEAKAEKKKAKKQKNDRPAPPRDGMGAPPEPRM